MGRECQTEAKTLRKCPRKRSYQKFTQVTYLLKTNVLPGWRHALDRRHCARLQCVRSQGVRSIACNCSEFPQPSELAMATRAKCETRVYMECARLLIIRSITVRLITVPWAQAQARSNLSLVARAQCARSHWQELQTSL